MEKKTATKKAQKSILPADDIKRYLGALAEDFQGRVSAIAEQFLGLNDKLDNHTQMFGEINERLDTHTQMFSEINEKLDEHSRILSQHTQMLSSHEKKLDTHTQMMGQLMVDVQEIKTDLKQKVDRSEFSHLEKRVVALEVRPRATV